jgi:surfactin synthase thioesterase subunit
MMLFRMNTIRNLLISEPARMAPVTLILLPFAGAAKNAYKEFSTSLPDNIVLNPVELPGRGSRYNERLLTSLDEMVEDIYEQIGQRLSNPYAIYGHSMGAVLGYLLAQKITGNNINPPVHLFFTGRGGPSCRKNNIGLHKLPSDQFIEKVKLYGGLPREILDNRKWISFFEPVLRADFQAVENYCYKVTPPLTIPVTVGIGEEDIITIEEAEKWRQETTAIFDLVQFPGDHFFIFKYLPKLMQLVTSKLLTTYNTIL